MKDLRVKRTIGLGDTIFALAAVHAFKQEHPELNVLFEARSDLRVFVEMSVDVTSAVVDGPVPNTDFVDLDQAPVGSQQCRYELMAEMLSATARGLSVPWRIPKHVQAKVRRDYPVIKETVVFTPWCGGFAPTRSIPDEVAREFIDQCPHTLILRHVEEKPGFEQVPNNICGLRFGEIYLAALLKQAKAVVSVDSGPAYLAISLGTPTVVAFTHIAASARLGEADLKRATIEVWEPTLDCVPCGDFADPANPPCDKAGVPRGACAKTLTADDLLERLHKVLT